MYVLITVVLFIIFEENMIQDSLMEKLHLFLIQKTLQHYKCILSL